MQPHFHDLTPPNPNPNPNPPNHIEFDFRFYLTLTLTLTLIYPNPNPNLSQEVGHSMLAFEEAAPQDGQAPGITVRREVSRVRVRVRVSG